MLALCRSAAPLARRGKAGRGGASASAFAASSPWSRSPPLELRASCAPATLASSRCASSSRLGCVPSEFRSPSAPPSSARSSLGIVERLRACDSIQLPAEIPHRVWEVLEFHPDGQVHEISATAEKLGLHPRDAASVAVPTAPGSRVPAALVPRANATVLRTAIARAVIYADRAVIFPSRRESETLKLARAVQGAVLGRGSLPFELAVLEAALSETVRALDRRARRLDVVARAVLDDLGAQTDLSSGELQRLLPIQRKLAELQKTLEDTLEAVRDVLEEDDELRALCLSERSARFERLLDAARARAAAVGPLSTSPSPPPPEATPTQSGPHPAVGAASAGHAAHLASVAAQRAANSPPASGTGAAAAPRGPARPTLTSRAAGSDQAAGERTSSAAASEPCAVPKETASSPEGAPDTAADAKSTVAPDTAADAPSTVAAAATADAAAATADAAAARPRHGERGPAPPTAAPHPAANGADASPTSPTHAVPRSASSGSAAGASSAHRAPRASTPPHPSSPPHPPPPHPPPFPSSSSHPSHESLFSAESSPFPSTPSSHRTIEMRMAAAVLESVEDRLEEVDGFLSDLDSNVEQVQSVWHMQLDHARNRVLRTNVMLSICNLGGLVATVPAAMFGMNLTTGLEETPHAFAAAATAGLGLGLAAAAAAYAYYRYGPKRRYAARLRDVRSLRDLLVFHMEDLEEVVDGLRSAKEPSRIEFADIVRNAVRGKPVSDDEIDLLWRVYRRNTQSFLELDDVSELGAGGGWDRRGGF